MSERELTESNPRRPLLTRKEQTLLAFLLALLIVGGIVHKLRIDSHQNRPETVSPASP